MSQPLNAAALATLFTEARTHGAWLSRPVDDALLHRLYDLAKLGPTSANTSPARFVFVKSPQAKQRLVPALMPGNVEKTLAAPVCVIVAHDTRFYEKLTKLWPHNPDFAQAFSQPGKEQFTQTHVLRNGSMQGAYLILAARALGLDCGPMSGFDNARLDAEFFPDGLWKSNFLVNIGYGDHQKVKPRLERLSFEEACQVL